MKAYQITNCSGGDENSVIVFAENATKAKSLAHHGDGFDCDWIELQAKRKPEADKYSEGRDNTVVDWSGSDVRIYWEMGWQRFETDSCEWCGRFEADEIPESVLDTIGDQESVCLACREQSEKDMQGQGSTESHPTESK